LGIDVIESVAVIDFETTGLSPNHIDRATEIAAVLLKDGKIVDRYQSLMNSGVRIPAFITELTGITDAMVRKAPSAADVMCEVSDFVGDYPLVAHNASFNSRFWDTELQRVHRTSTMPAKICFVLHHRDGAGACRWHCRSASADFCGERRRTPAPRCGTLFVGDAAGANL